MYTDENRYLNIQPKVDVSQLVGRREDNPAMKMVAVDLASTLGVERTQH